jgi:hypothetical protein
LSEDANISSSGINDIDTAEQLGWRPLHQPTPQEATMGDVPSQVVLIPSFLTLEDEKGALSVDRQMTHAEWSGHRGICGES